MLTISDQFNFIPLEKHPVAKRFELARLIGDYILCGRLCRGQTSLSVGCLMHRDTWGAVADPIIRNTWEKCQLNAIGKFLQAYGY